MQRPDSVLQLHSQDMMSRKGKNNGYMLVNEKQGVVVTKSWKASCLIWRQEVEWLIARQRLWGNKARQKHAVFALAFVIQSAGPHSLVGVGHCGLTIWFLTIFYLPAKPLKILSLSVFLSICFSLSLCLSFQLGRVWVSWISGSAVHPREGWLSPIWSLERKQQLQNRAHALLQTN